MQILLSISVLLRFGHGAQYEVTEEACANDRLFISSAEECEAAANALGITWNSCCQNNDNLPYGCLKRSDNDVIWNGKADTPNQFPCTVAGNCDHGMRWAVCYKEQNILCDTESWNVIEGNFPPNNEPYPDWSVNEDDCSISTDQNSAMWFGSADRTTWNPAYDHESFEMSVIFSFTFCAELSFRKSPPAEASLWVIFCDVDDEIWFFGADHGAPTSQHVVPYTFIDNDPDRLYTLSIRAIGQLYSVYMDGDALFEDLNLVEPGDADFLSGSIGFHAHDTATVYSMTYNALESPPKSHWIAAGNPDHDDWNGVPNAECAVDSRTQATEASAFAPGDTDIGVSCCTEDGSDGVRKFGDNHNECHQAKTYDEAEAICAENGYRLCSLEEMLGLTTRWKGCWHGSRYNWVSTECTYATGHQVARGKASGSTWDDWDPDYYCQGDDNNQAAYNGWSGHGRDIGVGCCSNDGTMGDRPKCDAHPATYQDAVAVCSSENMRVCTLDEIMSEITAGTGCNYDGIYLWTKDECDVGTDMSASSHFYHFYGSDGEDSSFDDFIPMVLGAAAGIAVIAGIVALVVAMRKKKVTEETVTEMSDVVHVPDASAVSVDGDEAVATR